jgi:hypothetical protein
MSELIEPGHERADMRMIGMAINRGWNIPDVLLEKLPLVAGKIATDPESTKREKVQAMELLRKFKADNDALEAKHHEHQHQHVHAVIPIPNLETLDSIDAEATRILSGLR